MSSAKVCAVALALAPALAACGPEGFDPRDFDPAAFARAVPRGFLFGAATAAHQIEGGNDNDWTEWEAGSFPDGTPHVRGGQQSGLACDSWSRWPEDVQDLVALGANTYRMSLEWSRLEPQEGLWDDAAAGRYREMLVALRAAGIAPMVTLHHFTLPRWLAARGGWEAPDAIARFTDFVGRAVPLYADLVDLWVTVNEPNVVALEGYIDGIWPPGVKDTARATRVYATLLEAHAAAAAAIRAADTVDADGDGLAASIGVAHHMRLLQPATGFVLDETIASASDSYFNDAVVEANRTGRIVLDVPGTITIDRFVPGLAGSMDFLGLNYYSRDRVRADLADPSLSRQYTPDEVPQNDLGWEIYPRGLLEALERLKPYDVPILVTENGIADRDDRWRADFLRTHLLAVQRARARGVDVRGYYHWSLMDNFEWEEGYDGRFGLYAVDFGDPARPRTARASASVFREVAAELAAAAP